MMERIVAVNFNKTFFSHFKQKMKKNDWQFVTENFLGPYHETIFAEKKQSFNPLLNPIRCVPNTI